MSRNRGRQSSSQPRDFHIHHKETLSRRFFHFENVGLSHRRFDGGMSRELNRERLHIGRAVVILPFDARRDEVLLIEQFRSGATEFADGPWLIECVAGIVEADEDIERAARRELREEAGLDSHRMEKIGAYAANPAVTTEFTQCFVADTDLGSAGGTHGVVEEDEDIRSFVVKTSEAFAMADAGQIICANALVPLRWLQINLNDLCQRWR